MGFPDGFFWGASTSSYQIEGGNDASAFVDWERRRGWEPCGAAADSWNRWREDLKCLQELGADAYRFSIEWSRIQPTSAEFDETALERYVEMARTLRAAGIRPIVCLHHFSEPAWLFERHPKGWLDEGASAAFVRFGDRVVRALRAEVSDWITFNEPMVWLMNGYALGHFPPGFRKIFTLEKTFLEEGLLENVLRAHRELYRLIHQDVPGARVAIAQNVVDLEPARQCAEDLEALAKWDLFMHRRILDLAVSAKSLDFIGLNYYTRIYVSKARLPFVPFGIVPAYAELEQITGEWGLRMIGGRRGDRPRTDMDWEIVPEGLGRVATALSKAYSLPIVVSENGLADATPDGRERFLKAHLSSLQEAVNGGAKVSGYLHWSLLDNYEWGSYRPRFGLYAVDRENDFRRSKASGADYFRRVIGGAEALTGRKPRRVGARWGYRDR
jgi:beta-glucosidase